jgi:hypothetical protein
MEETTHTLTLSLLHTHTHKMEEHAQPRVKRSEKFLSKIAHSLVSLAVS